MDAPEKDKAFSKLLARSLRQSLELGGVDCPDPAILAAYSEHALDDSETSHWERHFSNCSRCQQILAELALSGAEPVVAEGTEVAAEEMMDRRVAAAPAGMIVAKAAAVASVPPLAEKAAAGRGPAPDVEQPQKIVMPSRRYLNWRWLAPPVAAAAALALWFAVRPARNSSIDVAQRMEPPPIASQPTAEAPKQPTQGVAPPAPETSLKPPKKTLSTSEAGSQPAKTRAAARGEVNRVLRKENGGAAVGQLYRDRQAVSAGAEGKRESAKAADAQAEAPAIAASAVPNATRAEPSQAFADGKVKADQELAARARRSDQAPAPQPAAPPMQAVVVTQEALKAKQEKLPPAEPGLAGSSVSAAVAVETKAKEPVEKDTKERAAAMEPRKQTAAAVRFNDAFSRAGVLIPSPNGLVLWRVGADGIIERSRDAGRTWQIQVSNVAVNLVAGEAPSDTLCWVVGVAGTILRTTDGEHWEKISSPIPADWTAVKARDAMNATVIAAGGQRFVTADGGRTWRALPVK